MGNLLCDFDLPTKRRIVGKAFDSLPSGGALIVYDSLIDDERRSNVGALLNSLGMLLQKRGACSFSALQCQSWMTSAGFATTWSKPLDGPRSMVVGLKA